MILTRITDAADEPFTLAELKTYLRVENTLEDALIARLAKTARQQIERITGWALMTQSWQQRVHAWDDGAIHLRIRPAIAVTAVSVTQEDGSEEIIPSASWHLTGNWLSVVGAQPAPGVMREGIKVDFTAGHATPADRPEGLRQAVVLLTAHYYERRELVENGTLREVPDSVAALVDPFREVRL